MIFALHYTKPYKGASGCYFTTITLNNHAITMVIAFGLGDARTRQ